MEAIAKSARRVSKAVVAALMCLMAAAPFSTGFAGTVQPETINGSIEVDLSDNISPPIELINNNITTAGNYGWSAGTVGYGAGAADAVGTLNISNAPSPGLFASLTDQVASFDLTIALGDTLGVVGRTRIVMGATLTYQIEFSGPTGQVRVNEFASGGFSLAPLAANSTAGVTYQGLGGGFSQTGGGSTLTGKFQTNDTAMVSTGVPYTISLSVGLADSLSVGPVTDSGMYAFVDPVFTIVDVPDPQDYTIILSPGVGNSPATPLPAALPLFATGLGGLGLLGWRRKRKTQAVAP